MSRYDKSFPCFNGPKTGDYVDAPAYVEPGNAVALPWINLKGETVYLVYVLTELKGLPGLMFIASHDTPLRAQEHVQRITRVIAMAHEAQPQHSTEK